MAIERTRRRNADDMSGTLFTSVGNSST